MALVSQVLLHTAALSGSGLGKSFTHTCASATKQYNLVPA